MRLSKLGKEGDNKGETIDKGTETRMEKGEKEEAVMSGLQT